MNRDLSFPQVLKQHRTALDLTQYELAARVGCAEITLQRIEQGTLRPSRQLAERLAAMLDIPLDERTAFVQRARAAIAHPAAEPANPYKGLHAFGEADAPNFFGRAALTQRLYERLCEDTKLARFLAVVGPSGAGKSSVARAGLLPILRQQTHTSLIADLTPGTHPFEELEAALLRAAPNPPPSLLEQLQSDERGLIRAVKRVLPGDGTGEVVLLIDQFEELFTLTADERARAAFISNLYSAVTDARSQLRVIITLRADFYDRPLLYLPTSELFGRRTEVVGPLDPDELHQAINGPAEQHGLELELGLAAAIVYDVAEQPGTLPLMQFALSELFERRDGRRLTLAAYQSSGGVAGALSRRAEQMYTALNATEQAEAQQMFLRLITLGEGVDDTRRRVVLPELLSATRDEAALRRVLDVYGRYRMLTFDRDERAGAPTVEVAHEALLSSWERLGTWLADSRERLLVQRRLLSAAAEWQRSGQETSFLASGMRLTQFATLTEQGESVNAVALTADERAYVLASMREQEQAEANAREQLAREVGLRRRSDALRLAAEANSLLLSHGDNHLIALLALHSLQIEYTPAGDAALVGASALDYTPHKFTGDVRVFSDVAFSLDGRYLAAGGEETRKVLLWDVATGSLLHTFTGYTDFVTRVAFSPDSSELLTGCFDAQARLWNIHTGQLIHTLTGHNPGWIWGVAIAPNGRLLATASTDGSARIWDHDSGSELQCLLTHDGAYAVAFSPDSRLLLTGGRDPIIRLWDIVTGQQIRIFSGLTAQVEAIAYSPDGRYVAGGSDDHRIIVWEADSGHALYTLTDHRFFVSDLAFSSDSRSLLSGSHDYLAKLWDVATGQLVHTFSGHTDNVTGVAFAPDGRSIATASSDSSIRIWPLQCDGAPMPFIGHREPVREASFSPDGTLVLTAGNDSCARIWDTASGQERGRLIGHRHEVFSAVFAPDGRTILTAGGDTTVRLWDAVAGQELRQYIGHTAVVKRAAFAPNGRRFVTASEDGTARMWDVASGHELARLNGHSGHVRSASFAPDGTTVATAGEDGTVHIWDAATGQDLRVMRGHTAAVNDVAISPDGTLIATASSDGTARLWNLATGNEVRQLLGHTGAVFAVTFSSDGTELLTGANDQTARVWNVETGEEVRRLTTQAVEVTDATFSPDGTHILTSGGDGTVRLWPADYHDTIRYLCGVLTRDLTLDERVRYGITDNAPSCRDQ